MTTLLRKMWKTHSKHKKLCEEWALAECEGEGWWREVRDPAATGQIDVRYAGVAPVERAASAPSTALAVRSALHSAKLLNKKPQRVNLDISPKGIIVTDADSNENVLSISIYKISYCSADAANARVFAVVEGAAAASAGVGAGAAGAGAGGAAGAGAGAEGAPDAHLVHAFVCARRKHARALALALAHAFNDAYQAWQATQSSSLSQARGKRLAPWEESEEEIEDEEVWQSPAPLVTFDS